MLLDTTRIDIIAKRLAAVEAKLAQLETDAVLLDKHKLDDSMILRGGDSEFGTTYLLSHDTNNNVANTTTNMESFSPLSGVANAITMSQASNVAGPDLFCSIGTNYSAHSNDSETSAEVDIRSTAKGTEGMSVIELHGNDTSLSMNGADKISLSLEGDAGNSGDVLTSGGDSGKLQWRSPGVGRYFFRTFTAATNTINTSAGPIRFNLTGGNWHIVNNSTDVIYCRVLTSSLLGLGNGVAFTINQGGDTNINNNGIGVQIVSAHLYGDVVTAATSTLVVAGFTDVMNG